MVVLLADLGLRAVELTKLKKSMFNLSDETVTIPASIQKDYPVEGISPSTARLELDKYGHFSTARLLRQYFNSDWWTNKETEYLFPSRQSEKVSTQTVQNTIKELAETAGVSPHRTDGEASDPSELHPHALRHSLASYMLQDPETRLVDVRNRLRHRSISTTERIYEHFQTR
jgi:integrase/recombinase XerC/integrase/recombinase XerD